MVDHLKNRKEFVNLIRSTFGFQEEIFKTISSSYELSDKISTIIELSEEITFDSVLLVGTNRFPKTSLKYKLEKFISGAYWLTDDISGCKILNSVDLPFILYLKIMDGEIFKL